MPKKPAKRKTSKKSEVTLRTAELLKTARQRFESIPFQPMLDRVRKELKVAMNTLERGTERAKEQTVLVSKQAKLQYEVYLNHNNLQKFLASLGGRVYDLNKQDPGSLHLTDPKAADLISKISDLEKKIETSKEKIQSLQASKRRSS